MPTGSSSTSGLFLTWMEQNLDRYHWKHLCSPNFFLPKWSLWIRSTVKYACVSKSCYTLAGKKQSDKKKQNVCVQSVLYFSPTLKVAWHWGESWENELTNVRILHWSCHSLSAAYLNAWSLSMVISTAVNITLMWPYCFRGCELNLMSLSYETHLSLHDLNTHSVTIINRT